MKQIMIVLIVFISLLKEFTILSVETSIADFTFCNCTSIEKITISSFVTSIGKFDNE